MCSSLLTQKDSNLAILSAYLLLASMVKNDCMLTSYLKIIYNILGTKYL